MLAKKSAKSQITLPKAIASRFEGVEYFDVSAEDDAIVLRPLCLSRADDDVRAKLAELGLEEADVEKAVTWARKKK